MPPPRGARALPADVVAWLVQVFMHVGPAADSVTLAVINGALFSKSPKTRLVLAPQLVSVLQQHGIIEPGMSLRTFLECFDGPQDRTCKVQLDNKEPAHLRVAAQLRVLQAMSAHANCKGLLISAAGAEKALRRAHVNPQLIKALVSHIKNAIPPTVAGQGPVPAAQPQQPQLQGAAAAGGQQLPAAAAPEGQQPQQQERFLPLAVTNQSHQLPLTLPDIDKAVVKGIPHFYGLDMYDTHRAAAGIDNIITWATNKLQVDRPNQFPPSRQMTAGHLRHVAAGGQGLCMPLTRCMRRNGITVDKKGYVKMRLDGGYEEYCHRIMCYTVHGAPPGGCMHWPPRPPPSQEEGGGSAGACVDSGVAAVHEPVVLEAVDVDVLGSELVAGDRRRSLRLQRILEAPAHDGGGGAAGGEGGAADGHGCPATPQQQVMSQHVVALPAAPGPSKRKRGRPRKHPVPQPSTQPVPPYMVMHIAKCQGSMKRCVNPLHLQWGTPKENNMQASKWHKRGFSRNQGLAVSGHDVKYRQKPLYLPPPP